MMTSSNGNIFHVTGPLCGEFTDDHKGQWRGALMFSLICAWINVWVNNREAGDLRRQRAHYNVIVMWRYTVWYTHILFDGLSSTSISWVRTLKNTNGSSLPRMNGFVFYDHEILLQSATETKFEAQVHRAQKRHVFYIVNVGEWRSILPISFKFTSLTKHPQNQRRIVIMP